MWRRLLWHRQTDRLGQIVDGFRKGQPGVFHQKADCRAMRTTTEAMIELLSRTNGKRGALFVMKRAEPHEVRTALFQLHILADHVDDIDAVQQILQERMRNHSGGATLKA